MTILSQPSVETALGQILGRLGPLPPRDAPLDEALDQVLAQDLRASEELPPFPNSAMDGFAVRAADVASACPERPIRLRILAEAPAGTVVRCEVVPGTAVRIMTGAGLPPGTEAVVPLEHATQDSGWVEVHRSVLPGGNLRLAGEDVRRGETVLVAGTVLRPAEIGLLAAIGCTTVPVLPAPRVAVVTTGDELVDAGEVPGPGQVRDANLHAVGAQVRALGAPLRGFPRVPDRRGAVVSALGEALAACEVLLTCGGVSAGDFDFVAEALEILGAEPVFRQVNQKPGRPLAFWMLKGKPVFGLPGNPVAAMICFEMYVRPALRKMMGRTLLFRPRVEGILTEPYRKGVRDRRTHWLRVLARRGPEGWVAATTGAQGSGILSSMTRANAIAEIPETAGDLEAGEAVRLHLTDQPEDCGCS